MTKAISQPFASVYGPVTSWRFGQSLGIDAIGTISTCSFDCVYCQLGEIEHKQSQREIFVPTAKIQKDLQAFAPWQVDSITLSGSGEPTLALNLGEILTMVKATTGRKTSVLTNGTLLSDAQVRQELALADVVAVKIDAVNYAQLQRVNRPVDLLELNAIWSGLQELRQSYQGFLAIQTMILSKWSDHDQANYIELMQTLLPDEIQLNSPTRPRPASHELEARGNYQTQTLPYVAKSLKPVKQSILQDFAHSIQSQLAIPVRYPLAVTT